jgi:hypothetical protein
VSIVDMFLELSVGERFFEDRKNQERVLERASY